MGSSYTRSLRLQTLAVISGSIPKSSCCRSSEREQIRTLRAAARETGAENDVCDAALDRLDQRRDVRRVVFEVGVLDDGDLPVGVWDGRANRRTLAAVFLMHEHDVVASFAPALDQITRPVGRAVVYDDDLLLEVERPDRVEDGADRRRLVVRGHEEGHTHGGAA